MSEVTAMYYTLPKSQTKCKKIAFTDSDQSKHEKGIKRQLNHIQWEIPFETQNDCWRIANRSRFMFLIRLRVFLYKVYNECRGTEMHLCEWI